MARASERRSGLAGPRGASLTVALLVASAALCPGTAGSSARPVGDGDPVAGSGSGIGTTEYPSSGCSEPASRGVDLHDRVLRSIRPRAVRRLRCV